MFRSKSDSSFGVIGLGQFGLPLAMKLAESGKDCIVIDSCESKIQAMRSYTDYAFVVPELNREILEETGIHNCDTVIVCIGEKIDASILVTLNLLNLGVPRVVAKATTKEHGMVLERLGAEVVFPEQDIAFRLARRLLTSSDMLDHLSLKSDVEITKIKVTEQFSGNRIEELYLRQAYKLNIIAIENNEETNTEIDPTYTLVPGDILVVIGKRDKISFFESDLASGYFMSEQRREQLRKTKRLGGDT
ncbi:MAG: TrkA family potassium uptake protein [Eubacteriales bacterium]|nr:TrkA family potassium uptake protein [Eubacteriales bacterium]